MTFLLTRIEVDDYEVWKSAFDSDPVGARTNAKGHRILRGVDSANDVFIQVEFESTEEANAARERLVSSGLLDRVRVKAGPSVAEPAEQVAYA